MIYVKAARIVEKKVSCHKLDHVRTSQQKDEGRVVSMLSASRGGAQGGAGMDKICLVHPGERVTNHIRAPSMVPVKSVSFSSPALAKFYSGLPGAPSPGRACPVQAASAGCPTRRLLP